MLRNMMLIALRNFWKNKSHSLINLFGLSIGLSAVILALLYIHFEFSYDRYHENSDNIYRIVMDQPGNLYHGTEWWVVSPYILAETLRQDIPEATVARILRRSLLLRHETKQFEENRVYIADPEFLKIFSFPWKQGDRETALLEPFSVVLTEETAKKYFGEEDPIGKTIHMIRDLDVSESIDMKVTGIVGHVPENSHFKFDFLVSFSSLHTLWANNPNWKTGWLNNPFKTYIRLPEGYDPKVFDDKLQNYPVEGFGGATYWFHIQPLKDIHFRGHYNAELEANSDIKLIGIFGAIAVLILIIVCANTINLSTARGATRMRELGIRKVVGAHRRQLLLQLLGESVFQCFMALFLAAGVVFLALPHFRNLFQSAVPARILWKAPVLLPAFVMTLIVGLVSGWYPALFLSRFKPVSILKGASIRYVKGSTFFKNGLVTLQFVISISLIICTLAARQQISFMQNKPLGYDKDLVVTFSLVSSRVNRVEAIRSALLEYPGVLKVATSTGLPNRIDWSNQAYWEGKAADDQPFFYRANVDYDFLDLYGFEIAAGRSFSRNFPGDQGNAYIVNEAAVKRMGMENPIGQPFGMWKIDGTIVGVVKDFHYQPLNAAIWPMAFKLDDRNGLYRMSVKIKNENIPETLKAIESALNLVPSNYPFEYQFLDENLSQMYRQERGLYRGFQVFSGIALFLAGLGLLGLISFSTTRRTKEIGIRKVLGASIPGIVFLLFEEFLKWVVVANLMAWPLAFVAMKTWLGTYAYHVSLTFTTFIVAGIAALSIAVLSVGTQALRAARANPAETLKYE